MVEITLRKTDLKPQMRRYIADLIKILYGRVYEAADTNKKDDKKTSMAAKDHDFVKRLKKVLDSKFQPHWHVIIGDLFRYACKKRNGTLGIFMLNKKTMLIVYKSPGIEPLSDVLAPPSTSGRKTAVESEEGKENSAPAEGEGEAEAERAVAEEETEKGQKVKEEAEQEGATTPAKGITVLYPPTSKEQVDIATNVPRILRVLKETMESGVDVAEQEFVTSLRYRLSHALEPIWHVISGKFVAEVAVDYDDYVRAKVGKIEVLIYKHKQFEGWKFEWQKLLQAAPYLMMLLFLSTVLLQQYLCENAPEDTLKGNSALGALAQRLCGPEKENVFYTFGGATFAVFVAKNMIKRTTRGSI